MQAVVIEVLREVADAVDRRVRELSRAPIDSSPAS